VTPLDPLSDDVRQFLLEQIDSVSQLEALLLTWEHRSTSWDAETLAAALYVEQAKAKSIIASMVMRGWLARDAAGPDKVSFDSSWDPEGRFMQTLAATYRKHLVRVATLIHSRASAGVRDFAKAFDLKKKE
jgi:hypothetical protein